MKNITLTTAAPAADSGADPSVTITVTPAPAAGQTLRFALIVTDNNGLTSQPAFVDIPIVALPVAVISAPKAVGVGANITLDASASTPKGQVANFKWQLVPPNTVILNPVTGIGTTLGGLIGGTIVNPGT